MEIDGKNLFEMMLLSMLDEKSKAAYKVCRKYGIKPENFIPFTLELGAALENDKSKGE